MRVISGKYGSRNLKPVAGQNTRPTTDKIKESVFNLLGGYFDGGICLDFYAGSGGMGIEAVSRGMDKAILCEKYKPAQTVLQDNIQMTKEEDRFVLLKGNNRHSLLKYMEQHTDDSLSLVILDPPYLKQEIKEDIEWLENNNFLAKEAMLVCETDSEIQLAETISNFQLYKFKNYGQTNIYIYERKGE